jgi:methylenetetrahydrofolate--tRNA-(uracil-5-)-methyltransferase
LKKIDIVGGGLAGCEAALNLADAGWKINLFEMRPNVSTATHQTDRLAEIVCSNSFKSDLISTAAGLLKAELRLLNCQLLIFAEKCRVPAGNALAIDRDKFSQLVTKKIIEHPNIRLLRKEVTDFDSGQTIIATGPLTSSALTNKLVQIVGNEQLYFFDAIAPIVMADSLDFKKIYRKTRYDKGEADYLNCPFTKDEYYQFIDLLNAGEKHETHEFENEYFRNLKFHFYENCLPIEEIASRGKDSLRFGVMRPVGLEMPESGSRPFAVIQLRAENKAETAYNLVGCQTMLRYPEQKRIFQKIPGLENAEFVRYGSIHRNTYLNSPEILNADMSLKRKPEIFIAGQLAGVEGYMESIFHGLLVAKIIDGKSESNPLEIFSETTLCGQLWRHLITPVANFQPMNANFGLLPPLEESVKDKKLKKKLLAERSLNNLQKDLTCAN